MSSVENSSTPTGQPSLSKQDLTTLDVTKLTALSPEVISRQATINIGTIGHVAHGKSTVVKAVSGVQTVRFKNELERNITIKLEEFGDHPCEETEHTIVESSKSCENSHLCDNSNSSSIASASTFAITSTSTGTCDNTSTQPCKFRVPECRIVLRDVLKEKSLLVGLKVSTSVNKRKREEQESMERSKKSKIEATKPAMEEYIVEKILNISHASMKKHYASKKHLFLVKWKGWSPDHNTWEPFENLLNCLKAVSRFFDSLTEERESAAEVKVKVKALRKKLSKMDVNSFINELRGKNKWLKFPPKVQPTHIESLLRGIVKLSIKDPALIEFVQMHLRLNIVRELREKQLIALKDWENKMNSLASNKGILFVENKFDLELPPQDFHYINSYVPGENVVIPDEPPIGCNCTICCKGSANCCGLTVKRSFPYANKKLRIPLGLPIYECNKRCQCPPECENRVVQKGITEKLCIFRTNTNCGWGVKALESIKKGVFIAEYVGEVITSDEAETRGLEYDREGRTYLFDLDFNDKDNVLYTVDAGKQGNVSHFFNHSCDPNLEVRAVYINCLDPNIPQLALFTNKRIKAGDELTFDYLGQESEDASSSVNSQDPKNVTLCQCRSANCRKFVL